MTIQKNELKTGVIVESTDKIKITLNDIDKHIGEILLDRNFKHIVASIVRKKLSGSLVTSDEMDIADDALSHVIEFTLKSLQNQTASPLSPKNPSETKVTKSVIERYLIKGVTNYCNTRLRRWSTDQLTPAEKKENEQASVDAEGIAERDGKKLNKGKIGARAREYISSECASDSDFWDQRVFSSLNEEDLDLYKAAEIINSKQLSEEQIELVLERIAGKKFSDMAREKGGTEDQYRKAFNRALSKIGIDKKLLLNS